MYLRSYSNNSIILGDKETLEQLCINSNTGEIADPSEKIFSSEVLEKNKEQQEEKKIRKTAHCKVTTQIATEIVSEIPIFKKKSVNDTHPRSFETAPSSTSQETHPPPMTNSAFCASLSTATVNYSNNSCAPSPLSPRKSQSPQYLELSACPSAASEFCKLAPPALSTQALLPSSYTPFTDSNYTAMLDPRYSQPVMTTCSPVVTESPQWFPTMTTLPLPLPTQQYFDKSTVQAIHGSASQASQSSEPLQSCSQLPDVSQSKCIPENDPKNDRDHSKDKLQRFMDAFIALAPEGK